MALFLIVGQAHFVINNIFEGMIWFFLPVAMVITNDIFAYLCGITFGRTPLIKISPKKTWEGFLGAWFFTIIWGIGFANIMMRYNYFICPVNVSFHYRLTKTPADSVITGPRRQRLDQPRMHPEPRLPTSEVHASHPPARGHQPAHQHHHRAHAVPRFCSRHFCFSGRALWRLLRLRPEAHL